MPHRTGNQPRLWTRNTVRNRGKLLLLSLGLALLALAWGAVPSHAAKPAAVKPAGVLHTHGHVTNAQRAAAALRAAAVRAAAASQGKAATARPALGAAATPDYFGTIPNYANSPLPRGPIGSHRRHRRRTRLQRRRPRDDHRHQLGLRQRSHGHGKGRARRHQGHPRGQAGRRLHSARRDDHRAWLRGHGGRQAEQRQGKGRHPQVRRRAARPGTARPRTTSAVHPGGGGRHGDLPGLRLLRDRPGPVHARSCSKDLPATTLRGYVQIETLANARAEQAHRPDLPGRQRRSWTATARQVYAVDAPQYLGPTIVAQKDRPVRVKFTNYLPTGDGRQPLPAGRHHDHGRRHGPADGAPPELHAEPRHPAPARRRHAVDQRRHAPPVDDAGARDTTALQAGRQRAVRARHVVRRPRASVVARGHGRERRTIPARAR